MLNSLDSLRMLDAIDKYGSFNAAAPYVCKTPSALTAMIHKLEQNLNLLILDCSGHRAVFTPQGRVFLEHSRILLKNVEVLEQRAHYAISNWEENLHITLGYSFPFQILTPVIADFKIHAPETSLHFNIKKLEDGWEELKHLKTDIVIGELNQPQIPEDYSCNYLGCIENIFVISPNHPLAEHKHTIDNNVINNFCYVVLESENDESPPSGLEQFPGRSKIVVGSMADKIQLLLSGVACGYLPRQTARSCIAKGTLIEKKVKQPHKNKSIYMTWQTSAMGLANQWWRNRLLTDIRVTESLC